MHKIMYKDILMISSFPPRECGIATYTQDLITAIENKFEKFFEIKICALETDSQTNFYPSNIAIKLNTDHKSSFIDVSNYINQNDQIGLVVIQHEFGFFYKNNNEFIHFLSFICKPIVIVFHTVLPNPNEELKLTVQEIAYNSNSIIVMTQNSASILAEQYGINIEKISVIEHGTHLVKHKDKFDLKLTYDLYGKKVISTFGLLSSGKSIETTLYGLNDIIKQHKDVVFLIIGKIHPSVLLEQGEEYLHFLKRIIKDLSLENYVRFVNVYLPLDELLDYLQLTDIYLFTSKDRNQAVSGTFSYALSAGCPIVSTPIPHAVEVLKNDTGIIIDFEDSKQLSISVNYLLSNDLERSRISSLVLHRMASTAWENSAIAHVDLFQKIYQNKVNVNYKIPELNLEHIRRLTTKKGMIQFSILNHPDLSSGYTLDDNARALIAMCKYYELTKEESALFFILIYYDFIEFCLQEDGTFLNYVDVNNKFSTQNSDTNLEDARGRAIWALGYLSNMLIEEELFGFIPQLECVFNRSLLNIEKIYSTRAMAFIIKGIYYHNLKVDNKVNALIIELFATRLVNMYKHESDDQWSWFESYLTYANSVLPESILCAWLVTNKPIYKIIAKESMDFVISKIYNNNKLNLISNKNWLYRSDDTLMSFNGGEQAIEVAYTILAVEKFIEVFNEDRYKDVLKDSFNWFLGNNQLNQIVYNPCTGGCYDGVEQFNVNLNQGAESTLSYLLSRLTVEKTMHMKSIKKEQQNLLLSQN
jgi:glycosyltransferase involved in cell wall biosynthesis